MDNNKILQVNVASAWVIRPDDEDAVAGNGYNQIGVTVEDTTPLYGSSWAIRWGGNCMNHDGKWEIERDARDGGFINRCRWPSLEAALVFACEQFGLPSPMWEPA